MNWQLLYITGVITFAPASLGLGLYAWRLRRKTGAVSFAAMSLSVAALLVTTALASLSRADEWYRLWSHIRYLPLTLAIACFFVFAVQYSDRRQWLTRGRLLVLFTIPAVTTALALTSPFHGLFTVQMRSVSAGLIRVLARTEYGPLFMVHTAYSYALGLAGIAIVIVVAIRRCRMQRYEALFLGLGTIPPLVALSVGTFAPDVPVPLGPLGFGMMNVLFAVAVFRHRLLELTPIARERVIESMRDAIVVLDRDFVVADMNPAGVALLSPDCAPAVGRPVTSVLPWWDHLLGAQAFNPSSQSESTISPPGTGSHFEVRLYPLSGFRGALVGRVLIIRDVTERVEAGRRLETSLATVEELKEQLYEQAIRDELTGLFNRRLLAEVVAREERQAIRAGQPFSILTIDVDRFKELNDAHGHEAGDRVLVHLSGVLRTNVRATDYSFRIGGEEFLVIMPATAASAAAESAERLRAAVESSGIEHGAERLGVTVSIGVTDVAPGVRSTEEAMQTADSALYRAKANGRNRVERE